MTEWFEEWFNTEEYLNVYRHRNDADAEQLVKLIMANTVLPHNADVIDLACGNGRHSIHFAECGYNVTAVDLSENLLFVARKNAESMGLNIKFINSDLRSFQSSSKFDIAVNLFTSFGYFETDDENFSLFPKVFNLLKNKGYFVIDYFNANYLSNNLITHSEDTVSEKKIIQERRIIGHRVIKDITISKDGLKKSFRESVRMYSGNELLTAIENSGFKVHKVFGNIDGSKFDLNSSPRIIIISGK
jgi:cyclopropane fatty-acyl-phospholipid synthase-like methyltransferase